MKYLMIVRHGDYDSSDSRWGLTERGRKQIEGLLPVIQNVLGEGTVGILASPTVRTQQSADILVRGLQCDRPTVHGNLESSGGYISERRMDHAIESINAIADRHDMVIVVTHFEYGEAFPRYYGSQVLGVTDWTRAEIPKGGMAVINCEAKTLERVPPAA